ncbi:MAG: metallophosphoesterase [Clostridiales bacterium]|nr:metallophosphoesterase [Clostridiales bacterium]
MKITFIADLHHYSKTLGISGKAFELRSGSDQKCLAETGEIIDAAFAEIAESDCDAVFILGDVSNDGEMASHIELRQKLYKLQEKKDVYLITATHDWCCDENPRRFDGDRVFNDVEVMKSCELPEFYRDFGPKQAIDSFVTKIGTMCFVIELASGVRVLCLNDDKNENNHAGFSEECWLWIERQIKKAKEDGCLMIGIEHHLLMPHISPLITGGSVCVENREETASRFADAGLRYMFVGHSHIQATDKFTSKAGNTITEVNVGSLVGYPAPIVNVTVTDRQTLVYDVAFLKQFSLNGMSVDAQAYLAKHSSAVINRVLECRTKQTFKERLDALGLNGARIAGLWPLFAPVLKKIDTMLVWDLYKMLRRAGLIGKSLKKDALKYRYVSLVDFIDEIWLSALDGAKTKHEEGSSYYNLVMAVAALPAKILKSSAQARLLSQAFHNVLTGGDIDNHHAEI